MNKRLSAFIPQSAKDLAKRVVVKSALPAISTLNWVSSKALLYGLNKEGAVGVPNTSSSLHSHLEPKDLLSILSVLREASPIVGETGARQVRTSIVIPVFNKVNFTVSCLFSLFREIDLRDTEIIIVDNGSTDETSGLLSQLGSAVRVIQNSENLGFVHACNLGAASANGEYLLFLNNDTEVQKGWLAALLETAEADSSVGAVGSMLIYPNGELQEAGGIVWNDGSAANYGRRQSPISRKFCFAREVDYCSAASLLVRRTLFERLGGFDVRYAPAYYEDTDLCFGIRSIGFRVMFQPASRVVHHEGATAGTDLNSGFKRFQEINRAKFIEKWADVLRSSHFAPGSVSLETAADRRPGSRTVVFEHCLPTPDKDSGSVRMLMILKILARRGPTVFVPERLMITREYEELLGKYGVEVVPSIFFKRTLKSRKFDVAILSRPTVASKYLQMLRKKDASIKIIYDTVDVHFLRLQREHEITRNRAHAKQAESLRKTELDLASRSDEVWCVTREDAAALGSFISSRTRVIPNIHEVRSSWPGFEERTNLLFIGSFLHRPNVDAIRYFATEVLPHLVKVLPDVKLQVVGSHYGEELEKLRSANIEILGYVHDLEPVFDGSRVFIAPLRFGAGMKGKIGQALAHGLPVVTTSIGAEGMGLRNAKEVLIADTAIEFAEAIRAAYTNPELWQGLSERGQRHISRSFTPEVVEPLLVEAVAAGRGHYLAHSAGAEATARSTGSLQFG